MAKDFQERFMGRAEAPKFLHICPMSLFEEPRRSAKKRDEKFQGRCLFGSDVKVGRNVCCPAHGGRSRTEGAQRTARGRGRRQLLPASPSIDDRSSAKTLGMGRTQTSNQNIALITNQPCTWPVWTSRRLTLLG